MTKRHGSSVFPIQSNILTGLLPLDLSKLDGVRSARAIFTRVLRIPPLLLFEQILKALYLYIYIYYFCSLKTSFVKLEDKTLNRVGSKVEIL